MKDLFRKYYLDNVWGDRESRSGEGSNSEQTAEIRARLPELIAKLGVASIFDLPCGDFHWLSQVPLDLEYIGADIVPELIEANQRRFAGPRRRFLVLDATRDDLPHAELVLCRDMLVHLALPDIASVLHGVRRSGATWLLTTTFTDRTENTAIETGQWRPLNFTRAPFEWPAPAYLLNEGCSEGDGHWRDKSLGLWKIADLPA